jgi:hypothetical protein
MSWRCHRCHELGGLPPNCIAFLSRTIELGSYLRFRHNGALVAMAGERLHPQGWTEINAVCTDPAYRGPGLGGDVVSAVAAESPSAATGCCCIRWPPT